MFKAPKEGNADGYPRNCMWRELTMIAVDKDRWRAIVRALKQPESASTVPALENSIL